jgi:hypothetical protein
VSALRRVVFHPLLISIFPVLSLYVSNMGDLPSFREAIWTVIVVLLFTAFVWLLVNHFLHSPHKSGFLVSCLSLLFFSFGYVGLFVAAATLVVADSLSLGRTAWPVTSMHGLFLLFGVWCILAGAVFYLVKRSRATFQTSTLFLNAMAAVLIVSILVNGYRAYDEGVKEWSDAWRAGLLQGARDTSATVESLPDIYYIIMDGYARADILEEVYQFDSGEFLSYLDQRGFYVADKSRANYCQTALSLASSMNWMYLDDLADHLGHDSYNRLPLAPMIKESRLLQALRKHGYTIAAFSTGYPHTEVKGADIYLSPRWQLNMFQIEVMNMTPLLLLLDLPFLKTPYDLHRERMMYTLEHLGDAAEIASPKYVFVHVLAPHPPFVFGANGEHIAPDRSLTLGRFTFADGDHLTEFVGTRAYTQRYRDQLAYVTRLLREAIDEILANSSQPPIIIVQSDHGPGSRVHLNNPEDSYLLERMAILNAYYFPDQDYDALYREITPVNTFRITMDKYFGTSYGALEDRSYFSTWNQPYSFYEILEE